MVSTGTSTREEWIFACDGPKTVGGTSFCSPSPSSSVARAISFFSEGDARTVREFFFFARFDDAALLRNDESENLSGKLLRSMTRVCFDFVKRCKSSYFSDTKIFRYKKWIRATRLPPKEVFFLYY